MCPLVDFHSGNRDLYSCVEDLWMQEAHALKWVSRSAVSRAAWCPDPCTLHTGGKGS